MKAFGVFSDSVKGLHCRELVSLRTSTDKYNDVEGYREKDEGRQNIFF